MNILQYPIGKVEIPSIIRDEDISHWVKTIEDHPGKVARLVNNLNDEQLDTPYREEGWTIRQVIHHLGDSHTNSYIRFKWTLTEDKPIIKAYHQDGWAKLKDTRIAPIKLGLDYLKALHAKWVYLLRGLTSEDLKRCFIHPETKKEISLAKNIGIYAWHCEHHYTHIKNLIKKEDW